MENMAATVKPLIVCDVVKLFSIASTIAGASSGVAAMFSIRCLNDHTPLRGSVDDGLNTVRIESSTTVVFLIISSRDVLTWQPVGSVTCRLRNWNEKKLVTGSLTAKSKNRKVPGSTE